MRLITITIYARPNTNDNSYNFSSLNKLNNIPPAYDRDVSSIYQYNSMEINYSITSSSVTSTLILTMNQAMTVTNVLRSGQPIEITDNSNIIFQGTLLSLKYNMLPINENGQGGMVVFITLSQSIYQLTLLPMIFDNNQKNQIDNLLKINTTTILVGKTQLVKTDLLMDYMVSNTDLLKYFIKNISYSGLPNTVYLMATAGQVRDSILRASIDFAHTIFYQQENGQLIIRPLDATIKAPITLNIANNQQLKGIVGILDYEYTDNAASTPAVISNYNILNPNIGIIANAQANYLSYTPNPTYYPRIQQLQSTGWFSGQMSNTQINNNIVQDPSLSQFLDGLQTKPNQYMLSSAQYGAKQNFISSYQALLTGKEMGQALTTYANLECRISLDDKYYPEITADNYMLLGKCVDILNCDMKAGIIATYTRSYSQSGSFVVLNIAPLGSYTGYWVN